MTVIFNRTRLSEFLHLEKYRERTTQSILTLAREAKKTNDFLSQAAQQLGRLHVLGSGVSRIVYELPHNLVLKVAKWRTESGIDQNKCEFKTAQLYPDFAPKIYGWHRSAEWCGYRVPDDCVIGTNVIVAERAERYNSKSITAEQLKARWELHGIFQDAHDQNVGIINGRIVMIDLGCGHFGDTEENYRTCEPD